MVLVQSRLVVAHRRLSRQRSHCMDHLFLTKFLARCLSMLVETMLPLYRAAVA